MQLSVVAPFGFKNFPSMHVLPFIHDTGIEKVHVVRDFEVKASPREILQQLADHDLTAESYHSDFGKHIDLASDSTAARRRAISVLAREADVALALGVDAMVVHSSGGEETDAGPSEVDSVNFRRSSERLARLAARVEMRFFIENMVPGHQYGVEVGTLVEDIRSVGSDRLGLCFDTGHAHLRPPSVAQQIAEIGGCVRYIHAHDNDGSADQHLLPFSGTIDWPAVAAAFKDIHYDGTLCLEVFEPIDVLQEKLTPQWWQRFNTLFSL